MGSYELVEHTADVGVLARGQTLEEAYAQAALGLTSVMADPGTIEERVEREVDVTAPDREALLVAWLNELVYLFDAHNLLFRRFEVLEVAETRLRARCHGEQVDPSRHRIRTGVKSATYHQLEVRRAGGEWRAHVILDI